MSRHEDEIRRKEVRYEVIIEMSLEPRDPDRWKGWGRRRWQDVGMQVIREAMRSSRLDPSELRDSEDVEGQIRVLQVREIR